MDVYELAAEGRRRWPRDVGLAAWAAMTMWSLADADSKAPRTRTVSLSGNGDLAAPEVSVPDKRLSPEQIIFGCDSETKPVERWQAILGLLEAPARAYWEALLEAFETAPSDKPTSDIKKEVRIRLGLSKTQEETFWTSIRRALDDKYPGQRKKRGRKDT